MEWTLMEELLIGYGQECPFRCFDDPLITSVIREARIRHTNDRGREVERYCYFTLSTGLPQFIVTQERDFWRISKLDNTWRVARFKRRYMRKGYDAVDAAAFTPYWPVFHFLQCVEERSVSPRKHPLRLRIGLCGAEEARRRFTEAADGGAVALPEGVRRIEKNALAGRSEVRQIWVPDAVDTIDAGAFTACEGLETLYLPWPVRLHPVALPRRGDGQPLQVVFRR